MGGLMSLLAVYRVSGWLHFEGQQLLQSGDHFAKLDGRRTQMSINT